MARRPTRWPIVSLTPANHSAGTVDNFGSVVVKNRHTRMITDDRFGWQSSLAIPTAGQASSGTRRRRTPYGRRHGAKKAAKKLACKQRCGGQGDL